MAVRYSLSSSTSWLAVSFSENVEKLCTSEKNAVMTRASPPSSGLALFSNISSMSSGER